MFTFIARFGRKLMTYLITGATGEIGSRLVKQLLQSNIRPRIFVRDLPKARSLYGDSVDITTGDLGDPAALRAAFAGVDVLFLLNSGPELIRRDAVAAQVAKSVGVQRLVKLSSMDARQNVGTGIWHAQGEAAIRASGVPFTFVQPTGFMSNALFWAPMIKAQAVLRSPTGDGKIPFIHPDDIVSVAAEVLTTERYIGESLAITGPEALSYAQMAAKIAAAISRPIKFEAISDEQARDKMAQRGESPKMIEAHISIYRAIREGHLAKVTDTVDQVLGRKPLPFDQFVQENIAAFTDPVQANK